MGRIVNDLLVLARADSGTSLDVTERLDAADLVGSVVDAMEALADGARGQVAGEPGWPRPRRGGSNPA